MWFEATFVFTLLEPWEKILLSPSQCCLLHLRASTDTWALVVVMNFLLILLLTGIFQYFPKHLRFMYNRAEYYWYGGDASALAF
jgi:hypothetical protein